MKLDRNIPENKGRGKYALVLLRECEPRLVRAEDDGSTGYLIPSEALDFGDTADTDFFVIRLKDKYAAPALRAYAAAAELDDLEYCEQIEALADLAARHPFQKRPD